LPRKIARGAIEIINQVHLIKVGDKVTTSAVALLAKLDIKPFFYGVLVQHVYENGSIYPAHVLDLTKDELLGKFVCGIRKLAALSLTIGYPTAAAVPHALSNGFRKLLAVTYATNYTIKEQALLAAAGSSTSDDEKKEAKGGKGADKGADKGGDKGKGGKDADKGKSKKEEPNAEEPPAEEEEVGGGFGDLFG